MILNRKEQDRTIDYSQIQMYAEKVVAKYVVRSVIPDREKEDVVMSIIEKFINQKDKIDSSFEGRSKKMTYYVAILNRLCCEVIRKEKKHWYAVYEYEEKEENDDSSNVLRVNDVERSIAIKEEVRKLNDAILIFNGQGAKINLFMKFYFRIPVENSDVSNYSTTNADKLTRLLSNSQSLRKSEIFDRLATIVELVEGKTVAGDAVRMWLNKHMDMIINRMNMNGLCNHDRSSLQTLLEISRSSGS